MGLPDGFDECKKQKEARLEPNEESLTFQTFIGQMSGIYVLSCISAFIVSKKENDP